MRLRVCPFTVALFVGSAAVWLAIQIIEKKKRERRDHEAFTFEASTGRLPPCRVVFVLGGPGTGKGTQCQLAEERMFDWAHLSAGDILREERLKEDGNEDTQLKEIINNCIASGKLVPSEVVRQLIINAMGKKYMEKGITQFLIDGFPRSFGNVKAWQDVTERHHHHLECVINLECPEEVQIGRLLNRGKTSGREDDTCVDIIRKRFEVHELETAPVLAEYDRLGILRTIAADQPIEDVFQQFKSILDSISSP